MRVLAIHVIREDDDLENVRVNRFAGVHTHTPIDQQTAADGK